jgi:N-hydroxyarylamine O-acetyltransferase
MDVAAYLERIGYSGPATPNAEALRDIHRAHLFAVPFENLDIGWKREIRIDQQAFLRKIIEDRRGGFCYANGRGDGPSVRRCGRGNCANSPSVRCRR